MRTFNYFKKTLLAYLMIQIVGVTTLLAKEVSSSEIRTWTSKKGIKISAKALYIGESTVLLKTAKGKEITAAITSLSEKDVVYLEKLKSGDETDEDAFAAEVAGGAFSEEEEEDPFAKEQAKEDVIKKESMLPKSTKSKKEKPSQDESEKQLSGEDKSSFELSDKATELPYFTEGIANDLHAFYEGDKYVAKLRKNGTLNVYVKNDEGETEDRLFIFYKTSIRSF